MNKEFSEPFLHFEEWFLEASSRDDIKGAEAMNLATADKNGRPYNRVVLLKGYSSKGFVFYTNLTSSKGQHLSENPYASLCFYWQVLGRQIRIEGRVSSVNEKEADAYFSSRPLQSQLGAWVSKQSQPLESRKILLDAVEAQSKVFGDKPFTRPSFWSGFCLSPDRMEFWQEGEFRLHDRLAYYRINDNWETNFLYP